jgi:hypothetical protein
MSTSITLFLGLMLTLASAVVLYVASLRYVARHATRFPPAAAFPLLTPMHAWQLGARPLAIGLAASMALYLLLWTSAWLGGL